MSDPGICFPYVIDRPSVYLHTRPDIVSDVCDELMFGTHLQLHAASDDTHASSGEAGTWSRVKTDYGYCGYIQTRYLSEKTPEIGEVLYPYYVVAPFCDVLADSVYKYRPLFTLPRASVVYARREKVGADRFFPILYRSKRFFVPSAALRPKGRNRHNAQEPEQLRRMICDDALSYLGAPYRWGGRSPSGIDCSGLCFNAYLLNGLMLWRDAFADRRYVHEIDERELLPGDLIYFKGHMGLYIGDGEYVHSSAAAGCVTVNSLHKGSIIWRRDLADKLVCFARSNDL